MKDRVLKLPAGWGMLTLTLGTLVGIVALFIAGAKFDMPFLLWIAVPAALGWVFLPIGFLINEPNQAKVVQLFGEYVGTVTDVGFFWGNPFYRKLMVSLRVQTFETGKEQKAKVNDKDGTPIEVAAAITYRVVSAAEATFNVDNYQTFIQVQSDAALRSLASQYRYDGADGDEFNLRGHIDEVAAKLQAELQSRLVKAGVEVQAAQISHLAYAPEIASAMLQRQQAGATIAARALIVQGAVGMVEHALEELAKKNIVDLDPERKAAMVSNLLVVLCGHTNPQPVINAGTLHN